MTFVAGDRVKCIDASHQKFTHGVTLVEGNIYTVKAHKGKDRLTLEEIPLLWHPSRFELVPPVFCSICGAEEDTVEDGPDWTPGKCGVSMGGEHAESETYSKDWAMRARMAEAGLEAYNALNIYSWRQFERINGEGPEILLLEVLVVAESRTAAEQRVLKAARDIREFRKYQKLLKDEEPDINKIKEVVFG